MKELLDKLTSYNLFNYLLPGVLFVTLSGKLSANSLTLGDAMVGAFVCYFIGLIISRFGSLIIGPTLKKISFVKFTGYSAYVSASKRELVAKAARTGGRGKRLFLWAKLKKTTF